jgi:hypothetical protein
MTIVLNVLAVYAAAGAVVALAFVSVGVTRVQGEPVSLGARVVLFPGAVLLWPFVLLRWLRAPR